MLLLLTAALAPRAWANSSSSTIVCYTQGGSNSPRYRVWSGSSWSSESSANSVGAVPLWMAAANCPTRDEHALVTLDEDVDVNVQFYTSGWSSVTQACSNAGTVATRPFDVAYETQSGDMLMAYCNDPAGKIGWRTYNGTTLSGETTLTLPSATMVYWIKLLPKQGANEICLLALNSSKVLYAVFWNGSSFGSVSTLSSNLNTASEMNFDAAYESQSGDLLVVYGISSSNQPRYRIWNGSSWSSESSMPSIGAVARWIRLSPDPGNDLVLFAALDGDKDLNVNTWSGSAWSSNSELENNLCTDTRRSFDLAFEPGGVRAILVHSDNCQQQLRFREWDGSSWSNKQTVANINDGPIIVQVAAGPGTSQIVALAQDDGLDIHASVWSGSSFDSGSQFENDVGAAFEEECFAISVPAQTPMVPAATPYFTDFESGVGAEWSNSALENNGTYGKFAGRYRTSPLQLMLYTTVGETYSLTFDLYSVDSWNGDTGTYGPDTFYVTAGGTPIFSHTIAHAPLWVIFGCSYPHPADQYGSYGYNGDWPDGIFRKVEAVFTATAATTTLAFNASLTDQDGEGFNDESWGLDNLSVQPATFVDVSAARGFNVTTATDAHFGSGIHWADLDDDGDLDALLGGATARQLTSVSAGQSFSSTSLNTVYRQGAWLDIDNDGDLDFYSCGAGGESTEACYRNNGSASLSNAGAFGFTDPTNNEGCAAADVNGDGWCDVLIFAENGNWIGHHQAGSSPSLVGTNSSTYGMNGSGDTGNGDYVSSGDVNNDGYLDFLFHYNSGRMFLSDGDGTYTRDNHGISFTTGNNDKIGSAWGDYDNDGDLDVFVARVDAGNTGKLFRNDRNWTAGTGSFTDVTSAAGFNLNGKPAYSANLGTRGVCWGDYDNDGDLDLFIAGANGNHYLYQNQGNGTFARTCVGIVPNIDAHDACFVDFDNDGDLDLSLTAENAAAVLMQNRANNGNYLKVRVIGRGAGGTNKAAIGTRVELWNAAGTTRLARRDVGTARGYGGTEPLWLHFGGVNPATTYTVKVYFKSRPVSDPYSVTVQPNTESTTIGSTTIPQMLTITEPAGVRVIRWREVRNPDPGP